MDELSLTRRHFCSLTLTGIAAPSSLLEAQTALPHRAPKAKRVIYLFQQGAPSQLDLFDHKPAFAKFRGTGLPDSIRQGRRLTGMTAYQTALSLFKLAQDGQTLADRAWGSGFLPTPSEPASIFDIYGSDACTPGAYAANCILARRLSERGVPFIQLFHRGWYQHGNLTREIRKTDQTDHPTAALIEDLRQRGLLDDTLVVWGGEFGRTVYSQGTPPEDNYGRDRHPRCFSMFLAGRGIKPGTSYGETDDYSDDPIEKCVRRPRPPRHNSPLTRHRSHEIDFQVNCRHYRLIDVHGRVIRELLT